MYVKYSVCRGILGNTEELCFYECSRKSIIVWIIWFILYPGGYYSVWIIMEGIQILLATIFTRPKPNPTRKKDSIYRK